MSSFAGLWSLHGGGELVGCCTVLYCTVLYYSFIGDKKEEVKIHFLFSDAAAFLSVFFCKPNLPMLIYSIPTMGYSKVR